MDIQKIQEAVKIECDRQKVGEDRQKYLLNTYMVHYDYHNMSMIEPRLKEMAFQIEPTNRGRYRGLPVTFKGVVGWAIWGS